LKDGNNVDRLDITLIFRKLGRGKKPFTCLCGEVIDARLSGRVGANVG
jgi:hypothetical protein